MKYKILSRTSERDLMDMSESGISKYDYFSIRDLAWKFYIKHNITELPLDLNKIANENKWQLSSFNSIRNAELLEEARKHIGMTLLGEDDRYYVLYRPDLPKSIKRFTIAHEFGHIENDHFVTITYSDSMQANINKKQETEANMFAARILMPTIALQHVGVTTVEEIINLCGVSERAAQFRLKRLKEVLDKRQKFDTSPLEQQVHEQLWDFLEEVKNNK